METKKTVSVSSVFSGDSELKGRILKLSRERFWESGFSKVTMDELAYDLGISKKTLYIQFRSKKELFRDALLSEQRSIEAGLKSILDGRGSHFVAKLSDTMVYLNRVLPQPGRMFFSDMKRYGGDIWLEFERERYRMLREHFGGFLESGIREGILRPGFDCEVLITVLVTLVEKLVNLETLAKNLKTPAEAYEEVLKILFLGVLSEDGRKAYRETKTGE